MLVYRIVLRKYAHDMTGIGAALHGGRWNKPGSPVMYTGESKEIALLELIVNTPPAIIPELDILTIAIPDDSIQVLSLSDLPGSWMDYPAPSLLAEIAEKWIESNATIALKVPSCIIHSASNYLLNCRHPAYARVTVQEHTSFRFDARLAK